MKIGWILCGVAFKHSLPSGISPERKKNKQQQERGGIRTLCVFWELWLQISAWIGDLTGSDPIGVYFSRSPSRVLLPTFLGEGSPTKIDYKKKKRYQLILTSLLEDLGFGPSTREVRTGSSFSWYFWRVARPRSERWVQTAFDRVSQNLGEEKDQARQVGEGSSKRWVGKFCWAPPLVGLERTLTS